MNGFRFLHAADLHLGSQMQKLELYPGVPVERMRLAPQKSVERLFDAALNNDVDAVLIAGDIFDGPWQDMRIGLWLAQQMRRLERAQIPILMIRGNHDAMSLVRAAIDWPSNVHEFPCNQAATRLLDCGLAVHGRSFDAQHVAEDLAASYPPAVDGYFNVGLLHTSLTGSPQHDRYAPTEPAILHAKGYQYWALGHIHQRTEAAATESGSCWIGYSGNTQGRSVRECGPKGCYLIDVVDHRIRSQQFVETDVARWLLLDMDLVNCPDFRALESEVHARLLDAQEAHPGKILAVRLVFKGSSPLHTPLGDPARFQELEGRLRDLASSLRDIWLEKIQVETRVPVSAVHASAVMAELMETAVRMQRDAQFKSEAERLLDTLKRKAGPPLRASGWLQEHEADDAHAVQHWIQAAMQYLSHEITSASSSNSGQRGSA
jgi:DNA repair exonuclease SbcCD nuclease subunit